MLEIPDITPYYEDDRFVLYQGDCKEMMQRLPEAKVDMIFADPPYHLSNNGFTCQNGQRASVNKGKWDESRGLHEDFAFQQEWMAHCRRLLKPSGTIWVSGSYHSIYTCGFALKDLGFKILNEICWFKPNGAPNLSCRYFTASHETLIWAVKEAGKKHTFNYHMMKFGDWHKDDLIKRDSKQMRSVWSIGTARGEEKKYGRHPTQKPMSLLKRLILASTNPDDLIIDPFSGSGTTGLMAYLYGRKYIGFEMNPTYLDLSIRRFEAMKTDILENEEFLAAQEEAVAVAAK